MKRHHALVAIISISILLSLFSGFAGAQTSNYRFSIKDHVVYRGKNPFTLRVVQVPAFLDTATSQATVVQTMNRIAFSGGSAICFELRGLSADGSAIAPEAVTSLKDLIPGINGPGMTPIVKVFAQGTSDNEDLRQAIVKTVAQALGDETRIVFWIDGPKEAKRCKEFRRLAPNATLISREGGDIDLVDQWPSDAAEHPSMLVGGFPPDWKQDSAHFMVAEGEAGLDAMDKALADPIESQPWTPDNSVLSQQERDEGWIALFDGKTLNGWTITGKNKKGFVAEDGTIAWAALGGQTLRTRDRYDNFILRWEWKIAKGGNSGIHVRAPRAGRSSKVGFEYQMLGDYGAEPTSSSTGSVYSVVAPTVNASKPCGEWNESEIITDGGHILFKLNGQTIQDVNFDDNEQLRYRNRSGFLALTDHGHHVWYRNLRLKKL